MSYSTTIYFSFPNTVIIINVVIINMDRLLYIIQYGFLDSTWAIILLTLFLIVPVLFFYEKPITQLTLRHSLKISILSFVRSLTYSLFIQVMVILVAISWHTFFLYTFSLHNFGHYKIIIYRFIYICVLQNHNHTIFIYLYIYHINL